MKKFSIPLLCIMLVCMVCLSGCFSSSSNPTAGTGWITGYVFIRENSIYRSLSADSFMLTSSPRAIVNPSGFKLVTGSDANGFTVTATKKSGNERKSVRLDQNGSFTILGLSPGKYKITISHSNFSPVEINKTYIVYAGQETRTGDDILLLAHKYLFVSTNSSNEFNNLRNMLHTQNAFSSRDVYTLENSMATKKNIINQIQRITRSAKDEDTFVFIFSGRGNKSGSNTSIVTSDGENILLSELETYVSTNNNCRDSIIILDLDFSWNKSLLSESALEWISPKTIVQGKNITFFVSSSNNADSKEQLIKIITNLMRISSGEVLTLGDIESELPADLVRVISNPASYNYQTVPFFRKITSN